MLDTLASYRKEGSVWANRANRFSHGFSGIRVARSFVFYVVFCRLLFVFCCFSFGYCIACPYSIFGFWLLKSGSLRYSQFSGCWLILSVYILTVGKPTSASVTPPIRLKTFTQGQIIITHQVSPIIVIGIDVCLPWRLQNKPYMRDKYK